MSGRSSIGRIELTVRISAGCISSGHWRLCVTCVTTTKMYLGMQIGQIYFLPLIRENHVQHQGKIDKSKMYFNV